MSLDPLLPTAPARVRALLLPIGPITADRFAGFVARLREEHVVYLRDVTADGRPNRNMFSPLAYPDGIMFYDLSTHIPPPSHLALSPFDLHREPLAVVALADGRELQRPLPRQGYSTPPPTVAAGGGGPSVLEQNLRVLYQQLEELRDDYPKALVHKVVIFDYDPRGRGRGGKDGATRGDGADDEMVNSQPHDVAVPEGIATVPPEEECTRTTIKTIMCDLSSLLLAEMTSLAKSFEAMTHIESPGQAPPSHGPGSRSWADDIGLQSKRTSQVPTLARSSSAAGDASMSRLSLPPVPFRPASTGATPAARPTTPAKSGLSSPPVTFDDMAATATAPNEAGIASPDHNNLAPPGTAPGEGARGTAGDRVSVQGFGPGSLSERLRSKGRGRAAVVVGCMYLQAGRWIDALKELNEAATIARAINDHVWHGKALELVLVTVLLMGWAGLEFVVPPALQPPPPEKSSSSSSLSGSSANPARPPSSSQIQEVHAAQPRHLQQLQPLIPEVVDRILGLYSRISSESLPTLPLSEAAIRFCKLLSALHLAEGRLVKASLDMVVEGKYPASPPLSPRLSVAPTREHIVRLVLRAFPTSSPDLVTTIDRASILSGIASVLGPLGARRKRAMVLRELVSVLVTGLVEARTRGAAEVGIHPAAGLIAVSNPGARKTGGLDLDHGDVEQGIDSFLASLCASYGVVGFDVAADLYGSAGAAAAATTTTVPITTTTTTTTNNTTTATATATTTTTARIQAHSAARFFGFPEVKLDMLRACINFCEALPDFSGVLRFASDLLRTAGSGVAPGSSRREYAWPVIPRDEQVRLVNTVVRTAALAERMGPDPLFGEYWDEFLVRNVVLEPMPASRTPRAQPKSLLPNNNSSAADSTAAATAAVLSGPKNPFIYNAYAQANGDTADQTLVVGEPAAFRVTLQNPFETDLEIESIKLQVEGGASVEAIPESAVVGPYRTQALRLWITPREAGPLVVTGAVVQVRGCRERSFPIYRQAWVPKAEEKTKLTGMAAFARGLLTNPAPTTDTVPLRVIPPQPVLVVQSTSLPQSAMMVLEGERQVFSVTLRNTSTTTPVDLLLFSFEDSTQEPLKAALKNRDATTAELYEYELALVAKQALRLCDDSQAAAPRFIAPGATAMYQFELFGRPGLTSAAVGISYGHLGVPQDQVVGEFYTRQASVPLAVTVNASVELGRLDVISPTGPIPQNIWDRAGRSGEETRKDADAGEPHGHCLAVLDLRNAFPALMRVRLRWSASASESKSESESDSSALETTETILPGHTKRLLLPVPRLHIADPFAPVPSLVPAARQRQFVVSRSVSADAERAAREAFWFREGMLRGMTCQWSCGSGSGSDDAGVLSRSGDVNLRTVRLLPRMVDALRIDGVGISVRVEDPETRKELSTVPLDEFIQLRVALANRTSRPIRPAVRVLPVLRHRPPNVALDHVRKFAWSGTLQRVIPAIPPGSCVEVVIGAMALCRGEFEVGVTVEEVVAAVGGEGGEGEGGERAAALALEGRTERARGVWGLRRPCLVVVGEERAYK